MLDENAQNEIDKIYMRETVKKILQKYENLKPLSMDNDYLTVTLRRNYESSGGGSNPNPHKMENAIINKADADNLCSKVEKIFDMLNMKHQIILKHNYLYKINDETISQYKKVNLKYPTTYYREKNKAIRLFYKMFLFER